MIEPTPPQCDVREHQRTVVERDIARRALAIVEAERNAADQRGYERGYEAGRIKGQHEVVDVQEAALAEARATRRPISEVLRQRFAEARERARQEGVFGESD